MRLKELNPLFLALMVLISSCSRQIAGQYFAKGDIVKGNRKFSFQKRLELNKDSSFVYSESYLPEGYPGGDIREPSAKCVGKGKYSVKRGSVALNFARKIRKVDTVEVTRLTDYYTLRWWEQIGKTGKPAGGKSYVFVFMDIDGYYFSGEDPLKPDYLKMNDRRLHPGQINFIEYEESQFPLTLTFDFDFLSGQDTNSVLRDLFPGDGKNLGRNLGFQDEVITLPKPGNYTIEIRPGYGTHIIDGQVFTGTKTLPIKFVRGYAQIGELVKTKSNK
ncbi:MAG: hypothetical protein JSU01_17855 [Bacteroidetes bacterium]|nr:hypothetical protein [Bacteroidota bacterium]